MKLLPAATVALAPLMVAEFWQETGKPADRDHRGRCAQGDREADRSAQQTFGTRTQERRSGQEVTVNNPG